MKIVVASNNKNKIKEIRDILGGYFEEIYSLADLGVSVDVEENADTFCGNADLKAKAVAKLTSLPALSDDSGLCVEALNGEPGVHSARYAGVHGDDKKNNELLLKNMSGVTNRNAKFVSAVSLVYPNGKVLRGIGEVYGKILEELTGDKGFGYDPLFYSTELKKSFGQCSDEEKNRISHRFRALNDLKNKLI